MTDQLTLGMGTTHRCRDTALPGWGCQQLWDCDEEGCLLGERERCPTCKPHVLHHRRYYINRAKREPAIASMLQRLAANPEVAA